jgi:cell volume regulation protein A
MILGAVLGFVCGKGVHFLAERMRIGNEALYPVLGVSIVMTTFGLASALGGNGFLAVYICGIVVGNADFIYRHSLDKFHAGLSNIMQIGMFLILGLLVNPGDLRGVAAAGMMTGLFLMFVARPLTVFLTMIKTRYSAREKILIGWTGLRGAVPIILATYPMLENYEHAGYIFNLIFFVVILSVLVQGQTLTPVAKLLGLEAPYRAPTKYPLEFTRTPETETEQTREVEIMKDSRVAGSAVQDLAFPAGVTILLISRGTKFLIPKGGTIMMPGDTLLLFGEKQKLHQVVRKFEEREPPGTARS